MERILSPTHLSKALNLHKHRKATRHSHDDAQLVLYSQILPSDFLHFGYFDETPAKAEDISLSDIANAQNRYADLVLNLAGDPSDPVLDVGCGMGGLSRLLTKRGYSPTALTPDRLQATHVKSTLPDIEVIRCKLEKMLADDYVGKFGTIFTAESLQYLKLDQALPILAKVMKPGGKWVACDYFYNRPAADRSCHVWSEYVAKLKEYGWRITYEQDITQNVLPTLSFVHMWATRLGLPLLSFAFLRLRRKQPGLHHLAGGVLEMLEKIARHNVDVIDPHLFAASKRYMLLQMQRI